MEKCISLIDLDRPEEPFEVVAVQTGDAALKLMVPNSCVEFEMRRVSLGEPFEGSLGGREYIFDPTNEFSATSR